MPNPKLKPCPFCGADAEMVKWHGSGPQTRLVGCSNQEGPHLCHVGPMVVGGSPAVAARRWNKRVAQ